METVTRMKPEISTLSWCIGTLLLLYAVGGAIFSNLEREKELETYERNRALYHHMRDLYEFDHCGKAPFAGMDFCKRQQEFNGKLQEFFEHGGTEMKDHERWTFFGSAFFITTLVTTLGYGNLHPNTPEGQLFTVVFGLIGIPLMGYVLSRIGCFVVDIWLPALPLALDTKTKRILVLCSLMVFLILLGGVLFHNLEGWTFLEACYFSACTLMTVGFGDFLPGAHPLSRPVAMVFILLGLGVAASVIALLQIHVEIRGEHFAKQLHSWYGAVASECGGVEARAPEHDESNFPRAQTPSWPPP
eukprot:TRINITY_DN63606_c0_g1_i1.p1 TRINITY_DN63606_c0_g1~~TRINITY_DN63606_c0_g1_i1.p1  ORF type:complete len:302 (+),score=63.84 TRINITY_DN63606_c0_g1_i1:168-1073(+)